MELFRAQERVLIAQQIIAAAEQSVYLAQRCRQAYPQPRLRIVEHCGVVAVAHTHRRPPFGRETGQEAPGLVPIVQRGTHSGSHLNGICHGRTVLPTTDSHVGIRCT